MQNTSLPSAFNISLPSPPSVQQFSFADSLPSPPPSFTSSGLEDGRNGFRLRRKPGNSEPETFSSISLEEGRIGVRLNRIQTSEDPKMTHQSSQNEASALMTPRPQSSQNGSSDVSSFWRTILPKPGQKGCHLCGFAMPRTDKRKKCNCGRMVHDDCYKGNDGATCQADKSM